MAVVDWSLGHVDVSGQFDRAEDLRRLCVGLYQTIHDKEFAEVHLDFGQCQGIVAGAILPAIPLIVRYREQENVAFKLDPPSKPDLYRLFDNTGWAHLIEPQRFDPPADPRDHVPVRRYATSDEQYDSVDQLLEFLTRHISIERETLIALEWALHEIMDNVLSHAKSSVGGFVQATHYDHALEFIVADAGIGIPQSLNMRDHAAALERAVSEGGTRDARSNQGNGLYGTLQLALVSGGQFEIHSANGMLYLDGNSGAQRSREVRSPLNGTSVRCRIDIREPNLLQAALRFRGRRHDPQHDYTERTFGTDGGEMVYAIRERAIRDLGSRTGGARVRRQIENLLSDQDHVVIDFQDVDVVSSSFADEVFGRLFVDLGPRSFMSRIVLHNVNATIDGLIDRAIVQRTRTGNDPKA